MKELITAITVLAILTFGWVTGSKIIQVFRPGPEKQVAARPADAGNSAATDAAGQHDETADQGSDEHGGSSATLVLEENTGGPAYTEKQLLASVARKKLERLRQEQTTAHQAASDTADTGQPAGSVGRTYDLLERLQKLQAGR